MTTEEYLFEELLCTRCDVKMLYLGQKEYHEGPRFGFIGGVGELLVNKDKFHLYACPECTKTELFMRKPTDAGSYAEESDIHKNLLEWTVSGSECLSCKKEMPPDSKRCPHCGWSWEEMATPDHPQEKD